ncbi:MAG: 2-C-methyl-D-erythritol 2,4-cyclodiphosphate synthase [Dictyoglomus sp.]|nr:2-C-methyl-D-erythritol 2,4-cyclodiphosphate synthase [Dictyoglomus sp.]MCX7942518.1 2-C-methyl-D-erythritol 2,4-cyclodiphosphate synthase [Dictyoglomaceae bacterium]MDW8188756.1 2-C-methyl-D-erythritol 2,4-cyclodiphosphate synthase [Dictyoglomus sp.]
MFNGEKIFRIGLGYDIHPFSEGRKLFLGGIEIPYQKGLKGHSDGDVLIHAIMDALLGAIGLPDIGFFFPNNETYKDIESILLLKEVLKMVEERGFKIENIDVVVIAEEPKILPYREKIISNLAFHLSIYKENINIKATSNEGIGFIGKKEGIAVLAVALLSKEKKYAG